MAESSFQCVKQQGLTVYCVPFSQICSGFDSKHGLESERERDIGRDVSSTETGRGGERERERERETPYPISFLKEVFDPLG